MFDILWNGEIFVRVRCRSKRTIINYNIYKGGRRHILLTFILPGQ